MKVSGFIKFICTLTEQLTKAKNLLKKLQYFKLKERGINLK